MRQIKSKQQSFIIIFELYIYVIYVFSTIYYIFLLRHSE